jgi:photosystem II stability/assembly factor-like uncharacterized protein
MQCFRPHYLVALLVALLLAPASNVAGARATAPILPLSVESLLLDISVAGSRLVAVGERGHALYSDDNGDSWTQAQVPTTQMLTAVHFVDERRGWAVGHDGLILASADGGATWRLQRDGLAVQEQRNLEQREERMAAVKALEEALASADDSQQADIELSLEDARMDLEDAELALSEPVFTAPLLDVWFQDAERGWAVGAFGTLVATRDGGRRWTTLHDALDNPFEYHLNAVTGDGRGRIFIAGEGGIMYRSLDGGATWESLPPVYEGSWFGALHIDRPGVLLVFGLRGNVYRSLDFGVNWSNTSPASRQTLSGGSADEQGHVVLVGNVGTVLHSERGGERFDSVNLTDRLALTGAVTRGNRLIVVGQGGVRVLEESP